MKSLLLGPLLLGAAVLGGALALLFLAKVLSAFDGFSRFGPKCYCWACGQCTHDAKFRFYKRYQNSCEACLTCENAGRALWDPWPNNSNEGQSVHYEMSRWYKFRYALGNVVSYIGAVIQPKDPKESTDQQTVTGSAGQPKP